MRSGVDKHEFETGIDQAVAAADAGMILKQNHLLDPRLVRTALEIIARLQSSDPDFDDCSDAARLIDLLTVDCENNLFEIERLKRERSHVYYLLARIQWASASIAGWSKLKAHFGVPYREIPRAEFCEAVSLVARHVAEYQALAAPTAAAPIGDAIKAAITEAVKQAVDAKMLPAPAQLPAMKMSIDPRRLTDIMADLRKIYARLDALGVLASDLPQKWWDQHAVHGIG